MRQLTTIILFLLLAPALSFGAVITQHNVKSGTFFVTASGPVPATGAYVNCDATLGNVTLTLPPSNGAQDAVTLIKTDGSANSCSFAASAGDSLDGTAVVSARYGNVTVFDRTLGAWGVSGGAGYGLICDGVTDTTTALQNAINGSSAGATVTLPPANCHVTSIILKSGVALVGTGPTDMNGVTGTKLTGTAGMDTLIFPTSGNHSPFDLEHLAISGGRNALLVPANSSVTTTYVNLFDLILTGTVAGLQIQAPIEEWTGKNIYFSGGQYGIQQQGHSYIQKSGFEYLTFGGQSVNCFNLQNDGSLVEAVDTFSHAICQTAGQGGFYVDLPLTQMQFLNLSTERNGQTGKSNVTTAAVNSGSNSVTLASATGWANGDQATITGAGAPSTGVGAGSQDLVGFVCGLSGNTFSLDTTSGCSVAQNAGTTVTTATATNAVYDDFVFAYNNGGGRNNVIFDTWSPGGSGSNGHIRYGVNSPPTQTTFLNSLSVAEPGYIYDPNGGSLVKGGQLEVKRPGVMPVPGSSLPLSGSAGLVGSPQGQDLNLGLVDSNGDGSGLRGNVNVRINDANKTRVLIVQPTGEVDALGTSSRFQANGFNYNTIYSAAGTPVPGSCANDTVICASDVTSCTRDAAYVGSGANRCAEYCALNAWKATGAGC